MSQKDVENATGLRRCYTSRVENGHTVPSIETLQKYAAAFHMPLYRLFYEGDETPPMVWVRPSEDLEELAKKPGEEGVEARFFVKLRKLLVKVKQRDRKLFLAVLQKLAAAKR